jgi:hypothetical protein
VIAYRNPGVALPVRDALTEVLRSGARELLQQAIEAEEAEFLAQHPELKDEQQHQRIVRNRYQPESAPFKLGLARCRSSNHECVIDKERSSSARVSCPAICGGRRVWKSWRPGCT